MVHNLGIRIALGAFRTSPISSLLAESCEPSLKVRREILSLNYAIKINSLPTHPTYNDIFNPTNLSKFSNCPKSIKPLALKIKENLGGIRNYLDQQT